MSETEISQVVQAINDLGRRLDRIEQSQNTAQDTAAKIQSVVERLTDQVIDLQKRQAVADYRMEKQDKIIVGGTILGIMGFVGFLASSALLFLSSRTDAAGIPHIGGNP